MSFGTRLVGEVSFNERCWHCDIFSELYNDNALWAYSIWVSEEIHIADHSKVKDPVLRCLMAMGAGDWDKKEGAKLHQAMRAIRFSTALVSCLVPRILALETKVMKHHFIIATRLMFHLQNDLLKARHKSLESAFKEQATGAYATDLWIDEDLSALNQRCDHLWRSINAVEGTQTAMMEQMSKFLEHLKRLEESCAAKDERICTLEGKVEEGEQTLS